MEARTTRRRTSQPIIKAWNAVKGLDYSDKLELVTMLIDSVKPTMAMPHMQPYTMDEVNSMIDQSERDIAEGRVYDFDEAMDELEKEFAEEDRKLAMT